MILINSKIWTVSAGLVFLCCGLCEACEPAEYLIGKECCPMCSPGNRVSRHCTEERSTSCIPCVGNTFIDQPNGLEKCFPCAVCDKGHGLIVQKECTPVLDTVCVPLDGFYCTDPNKERCREAQKHSTCTPGQYIKQQGTPSSDTVCGDCMSNTYSDGSFTSCKPHTQCESLKMLEIKAGTLSSDSECGENRTHLTVGLITAALLLVLFVLGTLLLLIYFKKIKCRALTESKQESKRTEQDSLKTPVQEEELQSDWGTDPG